MSLVLAALLDTRSDAAVAVYLSLQNARAQRDALSSAARISLSGEMLDLFNAVLALHKASSGERNDLAHGVFGVVDDVPDEVVWCPSQKFAAFVTRNNQKVWNEITNWSLKTDPDPQAPLREVMFIYKKSDFEQIFERFSFLFGAVTRLHMALSPVKASAAFGLQWLLDQPQIQEELSRGDLNKTQ